MPVDHDAAPAIARVPLGHQVLVVGTELLGVGRAGGGGVTLNSRVANAEDAVDNFGDGCAQCILLHETAFDVA